MPPTSPPSSPAPGRFVSVGTKLAIATFVVIALVTAGVYVVLSRFAREEMIVAKEHGARMAVDLFLRRVSTPIFFEDATAITESVELLGGDPAVVGVELWRAQGGAQPGPRIAARFGGGREDGVAPRWVGAGSIDRLPDRLVFRDAVRDPDGKIIALAAVQVSLAHENQAFADLRRRILLVAAAVVAVLTLLLLAVTRRWIVGPLGRLLDAVRQVEAGGRADLVGGAARDEVGRLAEAFGRMAEAVARRERDIARRNQDMKRVLDNVGQGFMVLDLIGRIAPERSAILDRWFGAPTPGQTIVDYLRPVDAGVAALLGLGLEAIRDDILPLELLNIDQLPARLRRGERHFSSAYHPVLRGAAVEQLVLVISEVTAEVERDRAEQAQRDLMAAVGAILADRGSFLAFLKDAGELVGRIIDAPAETASPALLRDLHTLKGTCAVFGLTGVARHCHGLESAAAEVGEVTDDARAGLATMWHTLESQLGVFVTDRDAVEVGRGELDALVRAVHLRAAPVYIEELVRTWVEDEPVRPRLERLAEHARQLARRLDRCGLAVEVEADDLRLPRERFAELWQVLLHVVRNAVDHGLERADERTTAGKSIVARLVLAVRATADVITVEVADDGRGIDWDGVARRAVAGGVAVATRDDLIAALFADGVTTRDVATETSGRGVGLAAVRQVVETLRGTLAVESTPGQGTRFVISAPRRAAGRPSNSTATGDGGLRA